MQFTHLFLLSSLVAALPEQSLDVAGAAQVKDKPALIKRCLCGMAGCDGSCGGGSDSGCGSGGCGLMSKFGQMFKKGNFVNNAAKEGSEHRWS